MLVSDLHLWHVLVFGIAWGIGTSVLVSRTLFRVQRKISVEDKDYLREALLEHRNKAAEMVGGTVSGQLDLVKEDLRVALEDVITAEKAQVVAEDANQAKTDFLSRMSHEIRTPINGIVGSLGLIDLTRLESEVSEDIERAILSSDRLLTIVNELLEFSKLEITEVEYEKKPFSLEGTCNNAVERMSVQAKDKGLSLVLEMDDNINGTRVGDEQKLNQILINLIGNAIKFTSSGNVKLSVAMENGAQHFVGFRIEDTGIGIEKSNFDYIFDPFTQVDSGNNRKNGGTGLGLPICKKFIEAMGGKISVRSQLGKGSIFSFILCLPIVEGIVVSDSSETKRSKVENVTALVVDDDEVNRQVARRYLENMGVLVEVAKGGAEAVDKHQANKYDIILMDLQMPEMDGFEATRQIRANQNGTSVRIVSLTASLVGDVERQCLEAGMDGHLGKPFKAADLRREIDKVS